MGIQPYKNTREDVTYIRCPNEHDLIMEFMSFWTKNYPDVITGWNTDFFDIPYLATESNKFVVKIKCENYRSEKC